MFEFIKSKIGIGGTHDMPNGEKSYRLSIAMTELLQDHTLTDAMNATCFCIGAILAQADEAKERLQLQTFMTETVIPKMLEMHLRMTAEKKATEGVKA